jgi:biotin operon repressor
LYNDAAKVLLGQHSTVTKCYLALCLFSNGERDAKPSLAGLGDAMGVSRDTAKRAVQALETCGLLVVSRPKDQHRGVTSTYTLTQPRKGGTDAPHTPEGGQTGTKKGGTLDAPRTNNPQEQATKEKQEKEIGTKPVQSTKMDPAFMSRENLAREGDHSYWTHATYGARRKKAFEIIAQLHPNPEGGNRSLQAWREIIGTRLDDPNPDGALWDSIFQGVQWYAKKVKDEGTEAKYIKSLWRWIAEERWMDAPASIRSNGSKQHVS